MNGLWGLPRLQRTQHLSQEVSGPGKKAEPGEDVWAEPLCSQYRVSLVSSCPWERIQGPVSTQESAKNKGILKKQPLGVILYFHNNAWPVSVNFNPEMAGSVTLWWGFSESMALSIPGPPAPWHSLSGVQESVTKTDRWTEGQIWATKPWLESSLSHFHKLDEGLGDSRVKEVEGPTSSAKEETGTEVWFLAELWKGMRKIFPRKQGPDAVSSPRPVAQLLACRALSPGSCPLFPSLVTFPPWKTKSWLRSGCDGQLSTSITVYPRHLAYKAREVTVFGELAHLLWCL